MPADPPISLAARAIPFSLDDTDAVARAVDGLLDALGGERVQVLGLGEPTHGIEEPPAFRNAMFRWLVEHHGFTAIAIESSFPRGVLANDYIHGRVNRNFDTIRETAFSHGFGKLTTNRELIEWMRDYNSKAPPESRLFFYGFDGPMEMMHTDSPRQSITLALDALAKLDPTAADSFRARIIPLVGDDAAWENPHANMDPSKSIGDSAAAKSLRAEVDALVKIFSEAKYQTTDAFDWIDARHFATSAQRLLEYHHAIATLPPENRIAGILAMRDSIMADNLRYAAKCERYRCDGRGGGQTGGRVFVFAHNSHLQRGLARWQWGPNLLEWQPAGFHLAERYRDQYAVIATAAGSAPVMDIALEPNTLEAALCATPGPNRATLTRHIRSLNENFTPHSPNPRFFPLTPQHLNDFDAIITFDTTVAQRVDA